MRAARARRWSRCAAPMRRSGSATRSIGRVDSDASPVRSNVPSWPARIPAEQAHQRPRVRAVDRTGGLRAARGRRRRRHGACRRRARTRRRRARGRPRSSPRCRPSGRTGRSASRPRRAPPISTARCEIDLSPGTAMCPTMLATGSTRGARRGRESATVRSRHRLGRRSGHSARSPARRRRRSPAPRAAPAARCGLRLARDEDRQRAAPLVRAVVHVEVRDVDPLGSERLEDAREHARPVGQVDAQPLQSARGRRTRSRACGAGCRSPRRSTGRESPRRPPRARPRPARCGVDARRVRPRAPRGCRGRCRPRSAGWRRRCASCRAAIRPRSRAARALRRATRPPG